MQAVDELWGDEDAVTRVVDGHRDGARGQPALPGTLGEGEVGAHLHAALQRHVLPQHSVHTVGHHDLTGPDTCHRHTSGEKKTRLGLMSGLPTGLMNTFYLLKGFFLPL